MTNTKFFAPCAAAALSFMMGFAHAAASLPRMGVQQIVERNVSARGGAAAWQHIDTMILTGNMDAGQTRKDGGAAGTLGTMSDLQRKALERQQVASPTAKPAEQPTVIQLPFKLELARPQKMRLEVSFQGDTAVQVYDGAKGWKLRPYLGRHEVEPYTPEELKAAASEQELDGPLINYAAKGTAVSLEGTDEVKGRPAYRLKLTLKGGAQRRVWVDGANFLEVKVEGAPRRFDGRLRRVFTYAEDYKAVQGVMVPFTLETFVEGVPRMERITVKTVALNPPLAASQFAKLQ